MECSIPVPAQYTDNIVQRAYLDKLHEKLKSSSIFPDASVEMTGDESTLLGADSSKEMMQNPVIAAKFTVH